jgi:hypothetical protein
MNQDDFSLLKTYVSGLTNLPEMAGFSVVSNRGLKAVQIRRISDGLLYELSFVLYSFPITHIQISESLSKISGNAFIDSNKKYEYKNINEIEAIVTDLSICFLEEYLKTIEVIHSRQSRIIGYLTTAISSFLPEGFVSLQSETGLNFYFDDLRRRMIGYGYLLPFVRDRGRYFEAIRFERTIYGVWNSRILYLPQQLDQVERRITRADIEKERSLEFDDIEIFLAHLVQRTVSEAQQWFGMNLCTSVKAGSIAERLGVYPTAEDLPRNQRKALENIRVDF